MKSTDIRIFSRIPKNAACFLLFAAISMIFAENYSAWPDSQKIFLNTSAGGARVASTQYNFPLVIRLNSGNFKWFNQTQPAGADIRFANRWGAHLPYQIEYWKDNTGDNDTAVIWVNVDTIKGNSWSNYITMYWGNSSATPQGSDTAVFQTSNGFAGVWHLNEDPGGGANSIKDHTANAHNGTPYGAINSSNMYVTNGIIGPAINFNGSDNYIDLANPSSLVFGNADISVSAWIFTSSTSSQGIITKNNSGTHVSGDKTLGVSWNSDTKFGVDHGWVANSEGASNVTNGAWHYVVWTQKNAYSGTNEGWWLYVDGNQENNVASIATLDDIAGNTLQLGQQSMSASPIYPNRFNGKLDEVVISNTVRSADWVKLCYQTQKANGDTIVDMENYADWPSSTKVTINTGASGANVPGNVSNFPLLVRLDPSNFSGFANTLANGADIRFANSNGVHVPYQIERWTDVSGNLDTAVIWVLVDVVLGNTSSQYITMYWGKAGAASRSSGPTVFDTANGFVGVYHLNQASGSATDATAGALNGTANGSLTYSKTGTVGFADGFNGGGAFFDMGNNARFLMNSSNKLTVSAWVNRAGAAAGGPWEGIAGKEEWTSGNYREYSLDNNSSSGFTFHISSDGTENPGETALSAGVVPANGTWYYVTGMKDATTMYIFVNGVQKNSAAKSAIYGSTNATFKIGLMDDTGGADRQYWNGSIDEVRIEKANRSSDWIKLCYETQKPGSGAVMLPSAPVVTLQPKDTTVLTGSAAGFSADASGTEPITYTWYKGTVGSGTAAGTGKTFSLASAKTSDNGTTYYCAATNAYGTTNSRAALLVVLNPVPVITSVHPVDTSVLQNTAVTITAAVAPFPAGVPGSVKISYAWYQSSASAGLGAQKPNQTANALYLPSVQMADSGYYRCVATSASGTTTFGLDTSDAAHLSVAQNWQIGNPVVLARNVPGEFIDNTHIRLRISGYRSLPQTAPLLFPWYSDTVIVWFRANGWPADVHGTDSKLKFSLKQLQVKPAEPYDTIVTVPQYQASGCYRYYLRGSANWHNTQTNKDSLPAFMDTLAGTSILMCDTSSLKNPLKISFQYTPPADSVGITLSGLTDGAIRWDLISALTVRYLVEGGAVPVDTHFTKAKIQTGASTFSFTVHDSRFAGLQKAVSWFAFYTGINSNPGDTAKASDTVGVPRPQNPVALKIASVGPQSVGLSWRPVSADSICIWYGQVHVQPGNTDYSSSGLLARWRLPGTDTATVIGPLSPNTTYYFGLQIKNAVLWSTVTDSSVDSATTMPPGEDTSAIPNKVVLQPLSFDTAANRIHFDWTIDTTVQVYVGITWMDTCGEFARPPALTPPFGKIITVTDPASSKGYDLDMNGTDLQFDKDYCFGVWLASVNGTGTWSKPVSASRRSLHIPKPNWISLSFFPNSDTVYGFGNQVVLRRDKLAGADLNITGKLQLAMLPVGNSGCIPVSQAFSIGVRLQDPEPLYFGLRYDSLPQGYNPNDVRMYWYDTLKGVWMYDTGKIQLSTADSLISVQRLASDSRYPSLLMIDTTPPVPTPLGDDTSAVEPGNDILQKIEVRDNIANVKSSLWCGRGDDEPAHSKDSMTDKYDDTITWRVTGDNVVGSCGTRIFVIVNDGRFSDTVDVSRDVRVTNSDDMVPEKEKWEPLGATAVLDNPSVGAALDEFAVNKVFTYNAMNLLLYRWEPNSRNAGSQFKWVEYTDADKDAFTFSPGRLIWLKTRQTNVLNLGNGKTVSLKQPYSITLPAKNWTDFCLPYRFNIRIGDVLAATDTTAAKSLLFYAWKLNQATGQYITSQFYLPMNDGVNDKKSELEYMRDDTKMAYSVWNDLNTNVTLKIPGTPVALSGIPKAAAKKSAAGWSLAVRASTAKEGELSPVFCAYVAGGSGSLAYPLPPSWGAVSIGIYDAGRKGVFGDVITRELVNGGYAYELVFENGQSAATTITYHVDRLAAGDNIETALLDPESGKATPAGSDLSITVAGNSREYRWLAVGSGGYVGGFGARLARGEFSLVRITPNPLRGSMRIEYRIPYSGIEAVRCEMIDQLGRVVWAIRAGKSIHPGKNEIVWDPQGRKVASGTYIIRLTGFNGQGTVTGQKLARVTYLP